jgi:hypothetical protein
MNPIDQLIADLLEILKTASNERTMPAPAKPNKPYDAREHESFYP